MLFILSPFVYLVSTLKVRLLFQVVLLLQKNDAYEMNPVPPNQDGDGPIAPPSLPQSSNLPCQQSK